MGIVKDYVTNLATLNGEAIATVRGDAAMIAGWQQRGEPVGLVWAHLRGAGADEATITELQRLVGRAIPPWWAEYEPDEAGQSDAFLERHGADWAYVVGLERWHAWQGAHWQNDETRGYRLTLGRLFDAVYDEAMELARKLFKEAEATAAAFGEKDQATQDAKSEAKEAWARAMAWRRTDRRLNAVDNLCRDRRAVHPDAVNAGNLLNLANGTLDLDTYSLRAHERADMLTHCLGYGYDPAAQCPRWLQFLAEVLVKEDGRTPDTELAALFQEAVGYALTIETRYEAMFWLSGGGANGKSTALGVVGALLGGLAMSLDLGALGRPDASYYLARIGGARVVFSTEAGKGGAADDILKRLASGEPIPARPIRGEPITIRPVAKLFWALNEKPSVKDTSDGFWRRLRLIPFYRQFAEHERDTALAGKLREELPGVLNWALEGLKRLRTNGRFTDAAAVRKEIKDYRTEQNAVALWLNERTTYSLPEAQRPAGAETRARDAFQDYLQWAAATNRQRTLTETAFGKELKKLVTCEKYGSVIYLFGLITDKEAPAHTTGTEASTPQAAGRTEAEDLAACVAGL